MSDGGLKGIGVEENVEAICSEVEGIELCSVLNGKEVSSKRTCRETYIR